MVLPLRSIASVVAALTLAFGLCGARAQELAAIPTPVEVVRNTAKSARAIGPLDLSGRWTGDGSVKPAQADVQPFKCTATYFPGKAQQRLKQNLRCQNADYKIDVATMMQIKGTKITGTWEERTYSLTGNLSGAVVNNRMDVYLEGRFFEAKMMIVNGDCHQDVIVTPASTDRIEYLTASLRKKC